MTKRSPRQLEVLRRNVSIARAAYMAKVGFFQDRADCFEAGLAAGLPVSAALTDAGWSNAVAAHRAYSRHQRSKPRALLVVYNAHRALRRCGR